MCPSGRRGLSFWALRQAQDEFREETDNVILSVAKDLEILRRCTPQNDILRYTLPGGNELEVEGAQKIAIIS